MNRYAPNTLPIRRFNLTQLMMKTLIQVSCMLFLLTGCFFFPLDEQEADAIWGHFAKALSVGDDVQIQKLSTPQGYHMFIRYGSQKIKLNNSAAYIKLDKEYNSMLRGKHIELRGNDRFRIYFSQLSCFGAVGNYDCFEFIKQNNTWLMHKFITAKMESLKL